MYRLLDTWPEWKKLSGFAVIGGIGFCVDAGILTVMVSVLHHDVYLSRLLSFLCASLTTWSLNRIFVFHGSIRRHSKASEYIRYLIVQIGGALINLTVFFALIQLFPGLKAIPVIPLAFGAAIAMLFNFTCINKWVYAEEQHK